MAQIPRLSWADLNNLMLDGPDSPMHKMVLATLDRQPLLDSGGLLRISEIRSHVLARLMSLLSPVGVMKAYIRRQHMITVLTTNVPGPPGARVFDPVALPPIAGNVTVSFAALSYAGGLTFSIVADRETWPDLDVLVSGMNHALAELGLVPAPRDGSP